MYKLKSFINSKAIIFFGFISLGFLQPHLIAQVIENNDISPPVFSETSGFFDENILLSLTHPDPNAVIVYTLDGSQPDISNLAGKEYIYKNSYPELPIDEFGDELTAEYTSFTYEDALLLEPKSNLPNKLANISSTYSATPNYFPATPVLKTSVVRATAFVNGVASKTISHTYFIADDHEFDFVLPIISLNLNEDDFFDYDEGIHVAGVDFDQWRISNPANQNPEWGDANFKRRGVETEKTASFQYFVDGEEVLSQNIGVRIHGGLSRIRQNKTLRLYARSAYDEQNRFNYPFFGENQGSGFKRLILRNSGNDDWSTYMRDAMIQASVSHLKFDTQSYQPALVFLNGEFWGMLNIRNRYDKHYYDRVYNIDEEELDYLSGNADIKEGDNTHYLDMIAYVSNNDISEANHYNYLQTLMDTENFIDYMAANIYVANTDWPGNNIDFFRKNTPYTPDAAYGQDGRWRWSMFDTDFGFGLFSSTDEFHNTLAFATEPNGPSWPNPSWSTFLFRNLLDNDEFKNDFINRMADLMNTAFLPSRYHALIEDMATYIEEAIPIQRHRWNRLGTITTWNIYVQWLKNFATERPVNMRSHIVDKFGLDGLYSIQLDVSNTDAGYIEINRTPINLTTPGVDEDTYPWSGAYFRNVPVQLTAVAYPGYSFSHWSGDTNATEETIELNLTENASITAHYEATNEVLALHFWTMDTDMPNNTPLEELAPTYSVHNSSANIVYTSCLGGYPFDASHPNWRKASMERRNRPTSINYFSSYNNNIGYQQANMRGLQVRQPFQANATENSIAFEIDASHYQITHLSFAAKDEGAANFLIVEYFDEDSSIWSTVHLLTSDLNLQTGEYQLYEIDFTEVENTLHNANFKVRIRFNNTNPEEDEGNRVSFNNILIEGVHTLNAESFVDKEKPKLFPNPTSRIVYIEGFTEKFYYEVYTLQGKKVLTGQSNSASVNLNHLNQGIYVLKISNQNESYVQKIIKEQ